jgi:subtilisin-like proprotein convertase family protein
MPSIRPGFRRLRAARALFGLCLAGIAGVVAASSALPVTTGADWVSPPVQPDRLTVDMQRLPLAPQWRPGDPLIEIPRRFHGDPNAPTPVPVNPTWGDDPLAARQQAFDAAVRGGLPPSFSTPLVNIDVLASAASPNDPTGDIGTHQFVAAINGPGGGQFAAYDKATGAVVVPPTLMESLGTGGACAAGLGDPIVLFDELARRWVLTEFTSGANVLCVYISDRANLVGMVTWTRYAFTLPAFPDYPKYAVWPDAYYVGANEPGTSGQRPFYAMDRVRMLAAEPATLQRLTVPNLAGFGFQMSQPADLFGTVAPPPGSPAIFVRHRDDEAHNAGANNPAADFLELFTFRVNWTTPASSSITGPQSIQISEFSSNLNGLTAFNAFPQPSGQRLDPLRETVMHRLAYRNLGTHETLVGNLVTDLFNGAGSTFPDDTGAVRWFELRRQTFEDGVLFRDSFEPSASPTGSWVLHQEGTFAPADGTPAEQVDRWMAGSAVDAGGNIALAYNVVRQAPAVSAGLRYTGRLASDPPGVMSQPETNIVAGSGNTSNERWGDYNDMGVDPVDGCTFWFVGNYVNASARANRAASFRHAACNTARFLVSPASANASACSANPTPSNSTPVSIEVLAGAGFTGPVLLTFPNAFPPGIGGSVAPTSIGTFPGTAVATLTATNAAPPGPQTITLRASAGAQSQDVLINLSLVNQFLGGAAPTTPADAATRVDRLPTFIWQAVAGAQSYVVEASTSNTFGTLLFSQAATGTSLLSPVALPIDTQIFWRVRSVNACGQGSPGATFSFTTGLPAAPTPTAPANGATGVTTAPTFTWTAAAGATGHVVEASTSNTFGTLLFSQATTGTSLASPVALPVSTQVFWRVRGTNGYGAGANSVVFAFTTGQEYCRSPNLAIPDNNPTGASDNLVIAGAAGSVANLDVRVNIDHSYVGDLQLRLTRVSDNAVVNLMTNPRTTTNAACSGNNMRVLFDDGATVPAQTGCNATTTVVPTMDGSFVPQAPLSAFNGQTANGTWRITVIDNANIDVGNLLQWCLTTN